MNEYYIEVNPIIVHPACMKANRKQDCPNCELYRLKKCTSPRGLCAAEYKNHKKGCPNYGKRKDCPPNVPMFDQVFDTSKPIYAIYYKFDLAGHVERMRLKHPDWTEAQLLNVLYWQGTAKKSLKNRITDFNELFRKEGYYSTTSPEAMGVDVTLTMKNAGISLEWPTRKNVYKIAFAGIPLDNQYLEILR